MRILHAPVEIAGQLSFSILGLRSLGYTADGFFSTHRFDYGITPTASFRAQNRWGKLLEALRFTAQFAGKYDVFHFHYGNTLFGETGGYADARFFRRLKRRVAVQFWGSDIRIPRVAAAQNPYYVDELELNEKRARERMRRWAEITRGHAVYCDPNFQPLLSEYFPHTHRVEAVVDTDHLQPIYPAPDQRVPVLVHAPSRLVTKGTDVVRNAVETLKARGLELEYVEVHGVPQPQALELYRRADLVVDQLRLGHYGVVTAEAMALGKPVVCFLLPEAAAQYPEGFPVINANPETLAGVLEEWLQRPEERHALGIRSREYAERIFDYRAGARKLLEIYRSLPA